MVMDRKMDPKHQEDFRAGVKYFSLSAVLFVMLYWNQSVWTKLIMPRSGLHSTNSHLVVRAIARQVVLDRKEWCKLGEPCTGSIEWTLQNAGHATWPPDVITIEAEGEAPIPVNLGREIRAGEVANVSVRISVRELQSERIKFPMKVKSSNSLPLKVLRSDILLSEKLQVVSSASTSMLMTRVAKPYIAEGENTNICNAMRFLERGSGFGMALIFIFATFASAALVSVGRASGASDKLRFMPIGVCMVAMILRIISRFEPISFYVQYSIFVAAVLVFVAVSLKLLLFWRKVDTLAKWMAATYWKISKIEFRDEVIALTFLVFHLILQVVENTVVVLSCDVAPTHGPSLIASLGEKERQGQFMTCCVQVVFAPIWGLIALRLGRQLGKEEDDTKKETIEFSWEELREGFHRWVQPLWYISFLSFIVMVSSFPAEHDRDHGITEFNPLRVAVALLDTLESFLVRLPIEYAKLIARLILVVLLWKSNSIFTRLPTMSDALFVLHWMALFFWWSGFTMPIMFGFIYYTIVDDLTDRLTDVEKTIKSVQTKRCMKKLYSLNESLRALAINRAEQLEWVWLILSINVVLVLSTDVAFLYELLPQKGQAAQGNIYEMSKNLTRLGIWSLRVLMVISLWYATCSKGMELSIRSGKLGGAATSQRMKLKAADGCVEQSKLAWSEPIDYVEDTEVLERSEVKFWDRVREVLERKEEKDDVIKTKTDKQMTINDISNLAGDDLKNLCPISMQVQGLSYKDMEVVAEYASQRGPKMPHFKEMGGIILNPSFIKLCGNLLILNVLVKLSITSNEFLPLWKNVLGM